MSSRELAYSEASEAMRQTLKAIELDKQHKVYGREGTQEVAWLANEPLSMEDLGDTIWASLAAAGFVLAHNPDRARPEELMVAFTVRQAAQHES